MDCEDSTYLEKGKDEKDKRMEIALQPLQPL